jgi:hypothetical protein
MGVLNPVGTSEPYGRLIAAGREEEYPLASHLNLAPQRVATRARRRHAVVSRIKCLVVEVQDSVDRDMAGPPRYGFPPFRLMSAVSPFTSTVVPNGFEASANRSRM